MITHRLRIEDRIVGYERVEGKSKFYSKDFYWWNGAPIEYSLRDRFTDLKDKNNRAIFENDIIRLKFSNPFRKDRQCRVRSLKDTFELIDIESGQKDTLDLIDKVKTIEFVSFTFINLDLIFNTSKS
jgi:hypothetical protein